jgi:hypothetical protein
MTTSKKLRIGVFVPQSVQLLDLSPIDLFSMLSPEYLRACQLPAPLVNLGIPSTIHYISIPGSGIHIELTASAFLKISKTTKDKEVQPGMLDIILVPVSCWGTNPILFRPVSGKFLCLGRISHFSGEFLIRKSLTVLLFRDLTLLPFLMPIRLTI